MKNRQISGLRIRSLMLSLSVIVTILINSCNGRPENEEPKAAAEVKKDSTRNSANLVYGIPADSFLVETGHVRPNTFLTDILGEYGVSAADADLIARNNREVFDVRDIRSWHHYTVLTSRDSLRKVAYFIYEHDPLTSYIFSFGDSLKITPFSRKVTTLTRFSEGVIETSLWESMVKGGINPELAIDLSDIYAWTIDFFALAKGDSYSVIYQEEFVEGESLNVGRILCARFVHAGVPIYAIPYIQDGKESFYESDGKSLRKAFLKAPLRYSRIGSGFSSARMHPILRIVRPHHGVDYSAPLGTPVYTIGDGTVISAGYEDQSGRIIRVRHNSVYTTAYLHLQSFAKGIRAGSFVRQGDVIGYVGSTGLSTGPHLDFRVYMNGSAINPLRLEAPPVEPVKEENRAEFGKIRDVALDLINSFSKIRIQESASQ